MTIIEYLALTIMNGKILVDGKEQYIKLPEGCTGLFMAFESEEAGRKYFKDDALRFVELEVTRK